MSEREVTTRSGRHGRTAGIYDIRNIIGGLVGAYGVVLTLMGLFSDSRGQKTEDVNANLWAGLVLLAFGLAMMTWARLKPVVVPDDFEADDQDEVAKPPEH